MDSENLRQNIVDFFIEQYSAIENTESFIAFEPLGQIVDVTAFENDPDGKLAPVIANEKLSMLADRLPEISDVYSENISLISSVYDEMLSSASFNGKNIIAEDKSDYIALVGKVKTESAAILEDADKASIVTPNGKVFPCIAIPENWYDEKAAVWNFKKFESADVERPDAPSSANTSQLDGKMKMKWRTISSPNFSELIQKRVLPVEPEKKFSSSLLKSVLFQKKEFKAKPALPVAAAVAQPINAQPALRLFSTKVRDHRADFFNKVHERVTEDVKISAKPDVTAPPSEFVAPLPVLKQAVLSDLLLVKKSAIGLSYSNIMLPNNNAVVNEPVTSSKFSISFEYCVVKLHRNWFNTKLFDISKLWHCIGSEAGYFSTGKKEPGNKGKLRCIPKAIVVVKNIAIEANWVEVDKKVAENSIGLGCFNLTESSFEGNTLKAPSIQIIGWVCEVLPKLPLLSDPNMVEEIKEKVVSIYDGEDFKGTRQTLVVGKYNDAKGQLFIGNDAISSIEVAEGLIIRIFEHANFQGNFIDLADSQKSLPAFWNNKISSVIVYESGSLPEVTKNIVLFEQANYEGLSQVIEKGKYNGVTQILNVGNGISSVLIPQGMILRVYKAAEFLGDFIELRSDTATLPTEWNEAVKSMVLYEVGEPVI